MLGKRARKTRNIRRTRNNLLFCGLLIMANVITLVFVDFEPVNAANYTYVVNHNNGSWSDNNPGDGICNSGIGKYTFTAATEEASADGGTSEITFGITERIALGESISITAPLAITGFAAGFMV